MSYFTHYSTIITSSKWTVADSCPSSCVYLWLFLLSVSQMAEILHILSAAISIHPTYFTYRLPLHRCQFELKQTITYTSSFVSWNQLNTRLYRTFPICLYIIFSPTNKVRLHEIFQKRTFKFRFISMKFEVKNTLYH